MNELLKHRDYNNWGEVAANIRFVIKEYLSKTTLQSLVIGESGGIDSALTTLLVRPVCDELGITLIGRSISIETNKPDEIARAKAIGNAFCHDFKEVDLTQLYHATRNAIEETPLNEDTSSSAYKLRMGNIKARLRMIYLYNLAQRHRGMVLSTDNQTEWMLGFWTLHGDVGDFNPLFGLWKTEVYKLSLFLAASLTDKAQKEALDDCIACTPTDGLGITSSDVEQLGAKDYNEVDAALIDYLSDRSNHINQRVIARHLGSEFKRENPRFILREEMFNRNNS